MRAQCWTYVLFKSPPHKIYENAVSLWAVFSRIWTESKSRRFCPCIEECGSEKIHILAYFTQYSAYCPFGNYMFKINNRNRPEQVNAGWVVNGVYSFIRCPDVRSCAYFTQVSHKNIGTKYYLSWFSICFFNFYCFFFVFFLIFTSFSTLLFYKKITFCKRILAIWKQKWNKEKMSAGLYVCQRHVDVPKSRFS